MSQTDRSGKSIPRTTVSSSWNWARESLKARISVGQTKVKSLRRVQHQRCYTNKEDSQNHLHGVEEEDDPLAEVVLAALLDEVTILDDGRAPLRSRLEDLRVAHCVYSVYRKLNLSREEVVGGKER